LEKKRVQENVRIVWKIWWEKIEEDLFLKK
jgi:hypothetical protein